MASAADLPTAFAKAERAAGPAAADERHGVPVRARRATSRRSSRSRGARRARLRARSRRTAPPRRSRRAGLAGRRASRKGERDGRRPDPPRPLRPRRQHAARARGARARRLPRSARRRSSRASRASRRSPAPRPPSHAIANARSETALSLRSGSMLRRERRSVVATEAVGPYTLLRVDARRRSTRGRPGQFFMLEAPGRLLPRPMSLCLAPPGELAFLIDPIGPGTRALCALEPGDELAVLGPLGNGFRLDVERPLLVGGGIGDRAAAVPLRGARRAAGRARLPLRVARRGGGARAERRGRRRADARDGAACPPAATCSRAAPSRCSRRSARLAPDAQLAWEAPMACGYGACYGCAVEIDGEWKRLCVEGPVPARAASTRRGCLDALTAPDTARALDAFVTKTVTPLPRGGNPPVRIAETELGMLNSIGLANPGIERFLADDLPRLARARRPDLGLGRRLLGARVRRDAARALDGRRRDRAQPLVPERRRGARVGRRDRRRLPRGDRHAAVREALAGRLGHRRDRPRGRGGGRRRALAREHDPRPRARRADAAAGARARRPAATPGRR